MIVDCGAGTGIDTREMAELWSNGQVFAFEPVPELYEKLVKNTRNSPNVHCYRIALADKDDITAMFVSGGRSSGSSSLLEPATHLEFHPDVTFEREIEVRTATLDSWAEENGVDHVDMLWLDVQGYEGGLMKASPRIMDTVKVIYTEVNLIGLYKGAVLYPQLRSWLLSRGFNVVWEGLVWEDAGNVLFVRE